MSGALPRTIALLLVARTSRTLDLLPERGAMGGSEDAVTTKASIYGGKDPWDVPAYSLPTAARIIHVPAATLRYWVVGRRAGEKPAQPLIHIGPGRMRYLSFTNLIEAHVLASMRRVHEISLPEVRKALSFVERELGTKNPLAKEMFRTDGKRLFIERMSRVIDVSTGQEIAAGLDQGLDRIRYEHGLALRFFPYVRSDEPSVDEPKSIVMDSRIAFGRPVVDGYAVAVDEIAGRFQAGDSAATLADEFGMPPSLVEEAIRASRAAA